MAEFRRGAVVKLRGPFYGTAGAAAPLVILSKNALRLAKIMGFVNLLTPYLTHKSSLSITILSWLLDFEFTVKPFLVTSSYN